MRHIRVRLDLMFNIARREMLSSILKDLLGEQWIVLC